MFKTQSATSCQVLVLGFCISLAARVDRCRIPGASVNFCSGGKTEADYGLETQARQEIAICSFGIKRNVCTASLNTIAFLLRNWDQCLRIRLPASQSVLFPPIHTVAFKILQVSGQKPYQSRHCVWFWCAFSSSCAKGSSEHHVAQTAVPGIPPPPLPGGHSHPNGHSSLPAW